MYLKYFVRVQWEDKRNKRGMAPLRNCCHSDSLLTLTWDRACNHTCPSPGHTPVKQEELFPSSVSEQIKAGPHQGQLGKCLLKEKTKGKGRAVKGRAVLNGRYATEGGAQRQRSAELLSRKSLNLFWALTQPSATTPTPP